MTNDFLIDFAQTHAPDGGILYDVNGDNNYVAVLIHGDGRALQTLEHQRGITAATQPYLILSMPCGQSRTFESRDEFPDSGTDIPCPCGHKGHQLVVWIPVDTAPVEKPESGDPSVPGDAILPGHRIHSSRTAETRSRTK